MQASSLGGKFIKSAGKNINWQVSFSSLLDAEKFIKSVGKNINWQGPINKKKMAEKVNGHFGNPDTIKSDLFIYIPTNTTLHSLSGEAQRF